MDRSSVAYRHSGSSLEKGSDGLANGITGSLGVRLTGRVTFEDGRLRDYVGGQLDGVVTAMATRAKLLATNAAMRVITDAVQVLGAYGYVRDHPVERWMREAKLLQTVEGTNQIQRVVIARSL